MLVSQAENGLPDLPNENFDTGSITEPGKYHLNDEAQAKLLDRLTKRNFQGVPAEMRAELLDYFGHPDAPYAMKRKRKDWAKVQSELEQLKNAPPPDAATSEESGPAISRGF
jgi:hypothetical protein